MLFSHFSIGATTHHALRIAPYSALRRGTFLLLAIWTIGYLTCHAAKPAEPTAPADRGHVLLVQPVILCDDDGGQPARHALPKTLVDQAYTKADLEFLYLDPVRWNNGKALRGEINLNTIVKQGHANGMISTDPRIVTLLFVSAVDGNPGPLGRGLQGGNICFIALGPDGKMKDPAERAFVVGHEIGHCLGLHHTVDDPNVPDDVPNLQGGGPYDKRLAAEALHPTQVKTVLASPLSMPRRHFHSAAETAKYLAHDQWDNSCHGLSDNTIRFELQLPAEAQLPADPDKRADYVRKQYSDAATDFNKEDIELLNRLVDNLDKHLGNQWPILTRTPWNFAKMNPSFSNGYPHTRGLTIVLTDRAINMFKRNEAFALEILLHEKLHVIQRLLPARFKNRFKEYGFEHVRLPADTPARLNLIRNPDAPNNIWAIKPNGKPMLLATTLKMVNGKPWMTPTLHPLTPAKDQPFTHTPGPAIENKETIAQWNARFPIHIGHDDPREVAAYLLMQIFHTDFLKKEAPQLSPEHQKLIDTERKHLPKLLHIGPEKK